MMELLTTGFYVDHAGFIAISIVFPVLGLIAVAVRFFSRSKYRIGIDVDDWLCLPALASVIATSGIFLWGTTTAYSLGSRLAPGQTTTQLLAESPEYMTKTLEIEYAVNPICAFGSGMIRLSFLFFYRRIFRGRIFQILNWSVIGVFSVWIFVVLITFFSVCRNHLPGAPQNAVAQTQCRDLQGALSIIGFIFDLIVLGMPFPWIWRLQMPTAQKWMVSSVFFLGIFTVATSAIRMVVGIDAMTWKMGDYMNTMGLKSHTDLLGYINVTVFWSYIELGTGMVVCCLPSLGPFMHSQRMNRIASYLRRSTSGESSRGLRNKFGSDASSDVDYMSEKDKRASGIMVTNTVEQYRIPIQDDHV